MVKFYSHPELLRGVSSSLISAVQNVRQSEAMLAFFPQEKKCIFPTVRNIVMVGFSDSIQDFFFIPYPT